MKRVNCSAFILAASLFLASCGGGTEENTEMSDTTSMEVPAAPGETAPALPDTVNGIDTTVKLQENTTNGVGKPDAQLGK